MSKRMKIMSLSLPAEMKELLDETSEKKGISTSDLIRQLVSKFALGREDVKSVVLQIPVDVLKDKLGFQQWLDNKSKALANHFFPPEGVKDGAN